MKKLLLFLMIIWFSVNAFSQYKASNGHVYNVGDTITIGKGSAVNGDFLYIQMNGIVMLGADPSSGDLNMDKAYSGLKAVIKKIVMKKLAGQVKPCFTITMKPLSYIVYIEQAIESDEIK
jgi:hypothetical protein